MDFALPRSRFRRYALLLMAASYVIVGVVHFTSTAFFVKIMPPWLPAHELLVYLSGVAEIGLGLAVLPPRTRRLAGFGIIALLIAVFPANIHMAIEAERFAQEMQTPAWTLYLRLPFQLVFAVWALWATAPEKVD